MLLLVSNPQNQRPAAAVFDISSAVMLNTYSTRGPVMIAKHTPWMDHGLHTCTQNFVFVHSWTAPFYELHRHLSGGNLDYFKHLVMLIMEELDLAPSFDKYMDQLVSSKFESRLT